MEKPENIHPEMVSIIELLSSNTTEESQEKAMDMLTVLIDSYDIKAYPDYSMGLAGIGCGVQYILYQKYLDGDADEVLSEIDSILISSVYFGEHKCLTHAYGLLGIASYFYYRLEASDKSNSGLIIMKIKSALISILDILLCRFGVDGYAYSDLDQYPAMTDLEKSDAKMFALKLKEYGICNVLASKLIRVIDADPEQIIMLDQFPINKDLSDVTVVLPFRVDSRERKNNLHILLNYYTKHTNLKFMLLEADLQQHIKDLPYANCTYEFIIDNDPVFYHTFYRNRLIRKVQTPIVMVWDIDILIPVEQLYQAADVIRCKDIDLCLPYNGVCYGLNPVESELLISQQDVEHIFNKTTMYNPMFGKLTVGGLYCVNRKSYTDAGMDNERFKGWGPEDIERVKRMTILGYRISRLPGAIYHLWHPRGFSSMSYDKNKEIKALSELLRICSMGSEQLKKEVQTW